MGYTFVVFLALVPVVLDSGHGARANAAVSVMSGKSADLQVRSVTERHEGAHSRRRRSAPFEAALVAVIALIVERALLRQPSKSARGDWISYGGTNWSQK